MKKRQLLKMAIDLSMLILLLFLMGYQLWGEAAHEWAGAGIFLLFIIHQVMNRKWYRSLFRGRYDRMRALTLTVNMLLLMGMIGLMVSSVILSRYVFSFLPIRGMTRMGRLLHMAAAYWSFVLTAVHLGLHWGIVFGMFGRQQKRMGRLRLLAAGLAMYGGWVFLKRDIVTYLFLRTEFVFLDYSESRLLFYGDYLAMTGFFIYLAYCGRKILKSQGGHRKPVCAGSGRTTAHESLAGTLGMPECMPPVWRRDH